MMVSGDASDSRSASKFSSFSKSRLSPYCLFRGILAELFPLQVDTQVERKLGHVLFAQYDLALVLAQDLDAERQTLQLLHQHPEALRDAGLERVVSLDDGLVGLDPPDDVVGLDRQDLLEDVRGAVGLQRPYLHLAEPLAAELRLASQRLLGDQAVRTGGAGVDLVLDQVSQLEHVDPADRDRLLERLAGAAVTQLDLAPAGEAVLPQLLLDGVHRGPVEDGGLDAHAQRSGDPAQVGLQDLA